MATLKSNGEELLRVETRSSNITDPEYIYSHIYSYRSNGWVLHKGIAYSLETKRSHSAGWRRLAKQKATVKQYYDSFVKNPDKYTILFYKPE